MMKKLPSLLFALFISTLTFGQTNINDLERTDGVWSKKGENTPFDGEFIEYFSSGKLKSKGVFKNGVVNGLRIMYHENGNKQVERNYVLGTPNGKNAEYFKDGKTKQEGQFKLGKEDGVWMFYFENGNRKALVTFVDGIQDGDFLEYTSDGKLKAQYYFINGKAEYSPEFTSLVNQAVQLGKQFKNEEAIKLYDKALELNPTVAQAYFNRGACKGNNFDFLGAIADYDKAIEINPNYMEAYGNRGNAKINTFTSKGSLNPTQEQTASACEDFTKAVSLGDRTVSTNDMIYLYCKKNKKKKD